MLKAPAMRRSSFLPFLTLAVFIGTLGTLSGCFLDDGRRSSSSSSSPPPASGGQAAPPPSACSEGRPQILALDMSPSGVVGTSGDYEVTGTIRYSCSVVSVQAHVLSNDANVRWAPDADRSDGQTLSLRLPGSLKGQTVQYEVSVFDSLGNQSWPPLRQSASLE